MIEPVSLQSTRPRLTVKRRKTGESQVYYLDQPQVLIGRDVSNYVVLDNRTVSRKHAEILTEGSQYFVRDLRSNNGTLLNERPLAPGEKSLLRSGDLIQIEDFDISFHPPASQNSDLSSQDAARNFPEVTDSDLLEVKMVKKLLRAMDKESAPSLEVLDGAETGKRFIFESKNQDVTVGRDAACEFMIDSGVISRKHARFEKRYDTVLVHDLDSKNGTFVNREKITEKKLQDGDIIHLGTLTLSFKNPQELSFDFEPPVETAKPEMPVDISTANEPSQESSPGFEVSPSGSRASRRKGAKSASPASAPDLDNPPSPTDLPEQAAVMEASEPPSDVPPESFPEEDMEMGAASPWAKFLPKPLSHLSTNEIVAGVIGAIVLIGALWGIIKVF